LSTLDLKQHLGGTGDDFRKLVEARDRLLAAVDTLGLRRQKWVAVYLTQSESSMLSPSIESRSPALCLRLLDIAWIDQTIVRVGPRCSLRVGRPHDKSNCFAMIHRKRRIKFSGGSMVRQEAAKYRYGIISLIIRFSACREMSIKLVQIISPALSNY
jgi:hypothetical protein